MSEKNLYTKLTNQKKSRLMAWPKLSQRVEDSGHTLKFCKSIELLYIRYATRTKKTILLDKSQGISARGVNQQKVRSRVSTGCCAKSLTHLRAEPGASPSWPRPEPACDLCTHSRIHVPTTLWDIPTLQTFLAPGFMKASSFPWVSAPF